MMDIETIKAAKRQCESEIKAILRMFEIQSGCNVRGIDVKLNRMMSGTEITLVSLDVRIDAE